MSRTSEPQLGAHPLEPLTRHEIEAVAAITRAEAGLSARFRFISATLHEPSAERIRSYEPGAAFGREAEVILTDQGKTYEARVDLVRQRLTELRHVPDVQAPIPFEEAIECEAAVKAHVPFQEAMRARGITEMDLVWVDSWPAGYYSTEDAASRRLSRPLVFVCLHPHDNGYAHPVEGLSILVDLTTMEVVRFEDHGAVPIPQEMAPYAADAVGPLRPDLKPLEITQPQGVSYQVDGYHVRWQKWDLRLGFTHREGLVLHQVHYEDQGRLRPVVARMSVAEMIVPYGDPSPLHFTRNVLDEGE
ncbi:MAG TPA: tyramine oxidase, partial [Ktedonobacteraceae bacterium]